jgi:sortase A
MTDVETTRRISGAVDAPVPSSVAEPDARLVPPGSWVAPPPTKTPAARADRSPVATVLNRGLLTFAVAVLAFGFFLLTPSALQHGRSQAGLVRRFRAELATQRAPIGGVVPNGSPVALIEIPAIGVHEIVVQGTSSGETRAGPGHLAASVLPGQLGNSVVIGRLLSYGGPFRHLGSLHAGEQIRVTTGQGTARYSVVSEGTQPASSAEAMLPTTAGRLTLVTSDPVVFASRYRVAVASLESDPFAATGHASKIDRIDLGLTGDPAAAATLFVWLLFAALVGCAAVVAFRRTPRATAWLIVAPLVLAAAWLVFENLVVLLPASL